MSAAAWVGLVAGVSAAWVGLVAGVSAAWVGLVVDTGVTCHVLYSYKESIEPV